MKLPEDLLPHLFRTEFRKITTVLGKVFGMAHMEMVEDMVSDTFLLAAETWKVKGVPENPGAWLYTVAKNKAKDYLKRQVLFTQKVMPKITLEEPSLPDIDIDLSDQNIADSQLQMMFAICQPCIPTEAQIGLALRLLCGFGISEIADAFLSNPDTIYKRLARAKEKLRTENVKIELPAPTEINNRLENVLTTLYLVFNEGYYSVSQNTSLRHDLCLEAMRLTYSLLQNKRTNQPLVNALLALMCFHASRFEARTNQNGELVLYQDQDTNSWNQELIARGQYYLNQATQGDYLSKYHLEAAIAFWHTRKEDAHPKWESILQLYNKLLQIEYSPVAALNRTYALAKANGNALAIVEAEKLKLESNYLYHLLLGNLYQDINPEKAIHCLQTALQLAKTQTDKNLIAKQIHLLRVRNSGSVA